MRHRDFSELSYVGLNPDQGTVRHSLGRGGVGTVRKATASPKLAPLVKTPATALVPEGAMRFTQPSATT